MDGLRPALKGQYHAALDMLKGAIEQCSDSVWVSGNPPRSFWRLAYHTLFYTHFYLQARMEDFVPWEFHRDEVESADKERLDAEPYTREQILAYWQIVDSVVDTQIDTIDLTSPVTGFSWYRIPKLDHIIMNMRHIQEHAGQLRDRLLEAGIDQGWVTKRL